MRVELTCEAYETSDCAASLTRNKLLALELSRAGAGSPDSSGDWSEQKGSNPRSQSGTLEPNHSAMPANLTSQLREKRSNSLDFKEHGRGPRIRTESLLLPGQAG